VLCSLHASQNCTLDLKKSNRGFWHITCRCLHIDDSAAVSSSCFAACFRPLLTLLRCGMLFSPAGCSACQGGGQHSVLHGCSLARPLPGELCTAHTHLDQPARQLRCMNTFQHAIAVCSTPCIARSVQRTPCPIRIPYDQALFAHKTCCPQVGKGQWERVLEMVG